MNTVHHFSPISGGVPNAPYNLKFRSILLKVLSPVIKIKYNNHGAMTRSKLINHV
ncbi:hypothetical protein PORCAN_1034 [Porphyromonas crevioricanis JCM 13913]|nr:hypothetical protein PORCAN_1034 [Porphyromonas crevioricanis JCM 13913]